MFIASQVVYCCNTIQATDWSFYLISKPVRSNQIITMNYPISSVTKASKGEQLRQSKNMNMKDHQIKKNMEQKY